MKIVLLGGTKGIGRELGRELAERGHDLFLLGRDLGELEKSARDMEQRGGGERRIGHAHCDLEQPAGFGAALAQADQALAGFDSVVVTAAAFATQAALENDSGLAARLLTVDFVNTVVFCEHARRLLLARGGGRLCVLSSVAGERGRKPVVLYGASKAGLSAYLEGLDHKFYAQGLRVICVKPGFVKTSMTEGLEPPPFAGEPTRVGKAIARALERETPVLYTPAIWRFIMLVIRLLPRFVMRRIGF